MALTRRALSTMGIEEEKIDQIISMHVDTVNGLKEQIDQYKADAEKLPAVQKELEVLQKNAEDGDSLKAKYDQIVAEKKALQKEYDDFRKDTEGKEVRNAKEKAFTEIMKDVGIPDKHFAKVIKYSDIDGLELDDKGKITTSKDLLKSLKEEWGDHIEKESTKGANTATPPQTSGSSTTGIAASLEQKYHAGLYGKAKED